MTCTWPIRAKADSQSPAADRYKLSVQQFDAQLAGLAQVRPDAPVGAAFPEPEADAVWLRARLRYLLTVDDGGVSYYTLVADRLEARGWRGHCFVSTDAIGTRGFLSASQLRELDTRGHVIGTHSASHPARFSACEPDRMREEWSRSRKVLEDLLGRKVDDRIGARRLSTRGASHAAPRDAGFRVVFTSEPTITTPQTKTESWSLDDSRFDADTRPTALARLARREPWTRYQEWASWNAKGLVKPLLGPLYSRRAADRTAVVDIRHIETFRDAPTAQQDP